jgi:secreted trypsin-like serine protease
VKIIQISVILVIYINKNLSCVSLQGDSGGPLMLEREDGRWVLVGTVSHGIKCAAPYLPGVYMRTTFYKPWLHAITGVN